MKFLVIAVGHRMPGWVDAGFNEYVRRMPPETRVELAALKPGRSEAGAAARADEARRIRAALPARCERVVLDERGTLLTSAALAGRLAAWQRAGRDVAFILGGADGLDAELKRSADFVWSLSPLTLPHALARVVLAEQLYRAVCILHNHPYHRA